MFTETVGFGSTVMFIVSVAVPQFWLLVTTSAITAVPVPVNVTVEVRDVGSVIVAGPLTTFQRGVPLEALPASVNVAVAPGEQIS